MTTIQPLVNQIIHGDCIDVMRTMPDQSVDLIVTDPPYVVRYRSRDGRSCANDDNTRWITPAFTEMFRVLKPDSFCLSFYGWHKVDCFMGAWRAAGYCHRPALRGALPFPRRPGLRQRRQYPVDYAGI